MYETVMTRRSFASAGALAAGGVMMGAASAWRMRLSASTVMFGSLPVNRACERIAALGFEAVDFWAPNWCDHLEVLRTKYGASGLRELLARHNLKLYAFSVYGPGYAKYAELLGKAGGGVAVRGSEKRSDKPLTVQMKAFLESLKPELELAEKYDSYLAIENHGNALLNTHDSFRAFVDWNRHPRLGIAIAPFHIQRTGDSVEEVIETAGGQILFFYAWQNGQEMNQLPGFGPADFTPWLEALAKTGYRWYVNPFMHHGPGPDAMSAALRNSCAYLQRCYRKIRG